MPFSRRATLDTGSPPSPTAVSMALHAANLISPLHPRKSRQRSTLLALVLLVCLTAYVFIVHSADFTSSSLRHDSPLASQQLAQALETIQNTHHSSGASFRHRMKSHLYRPGIELTSEQELAAVTSFLASLTQNVLPSTVDPSKPIDPSLVLDFDVRSPRAPEEVKAMVEDVWNRNPVFAYTKFYHPLSRELKALLRDLNLKPEPVFIDVDTREDVEILAPLLRRLASSPELPLLLIGGEPILKSIEELREMEKSGDLQQLITAAGAIVNGAKKRKSKK